MCKFKSCSGHKKRFFPDFPLDFFYQVRYAFFMNAKHRPKFFCESCNTEVPLDAKFCPKCGRFFASVRCPACGQTGEHSDFAKGCPRCGYAMAGYSRGGTDTAKDKKRNKRNDDPLPAWIYIATFVLLGAVLAILYRFLFR